MKLFKDEFEFKKPSIRVKHFWLKFNIFLDVYVFIYWVVVAGLCAFSNYRLSGVQIAVVLIITIIAIIGWLLRDITRLLKEKLDEQKN